MHRSPHFLLLAAALLGLGTTLKAFADPPPENPEQQRRLLTLARQDPEQLARLRQDLQVFLALPAERQESLRRLDRDLQERDPATQARLRRTAERYETWLRSLPEADRREIEQAPDAATRLRLVKEVRERQWIERLPKAYRDKLQTLKGADRQIFIEELRLRERKSQQEWDRAVRHWSELLKGPPPLRLTDLPPEVQTFVKNQLLPVLDEKEKETLKNAEGRPLFLRTLLELLRKHRLRGRAPLARIGGD
jgi:hypothetical protein